MSLCYGLLPDTHLALEELKEFHNLLFKNTDATFEWFRWYLGRIALEHPNQYKTRIYTLRDGPRLVGTWCVEPKDFRLNGRTIKVGRCFSVGIHPDYRRRNLFVELSNHAIVSERDMKQYEYVLGFPQVGRPVIDAHLKSDWETVQTIDAYSYTPKKEDSPVSLKYTYTIDSFDTWEPIRELPGSFVETDRYRNVRWLDHPDCHYVCLSHGRSYIVMKPYGSACHVLALAGESSEVRMLLRASKTLAYRHRWDEVTIWNAASEHHHEDIVACGFSPGATKATSVVLLAVKINALDPLVLDKCHFQMGSEEIY